MQRNAFDQIIVSLKNADHAREQADILEEELRDRVKDPYSIILTQIVAANIREEEGFTPNGVYDGE